MLVPVHSNYIINSRVLVCYYKVLIFDTFACGTDILSLKLYFCFVSSDMPSVLSGDQIHFTDPYKEHFSTKEKERSGYRFKLGSGKHAISKWPQQFEPFLDHFGCSMNHLQNGTFNGTMFRFPLREQKKDRSGKEVLSETIYDGKMVNQLFESFASDAHNCLIFLKHIEKIELSFRRKGQEKEETYMIIQISDSCLESVKSKKRNFQDRVKCGQWLEKRESLCYELELETFLYKSGTAKTMDYSYLVCELFGGGYSAGQLDQLSVDPTISSRPIVGVALPLTMNMTQNDADKPESIGQIFCFLPLPVEQKCPSGLPIHVNGVFSISPNRRHLKWPSSGQDITKDRSLMWNHGLLTELVPQHTMNFFNGQCI